MEILTSSLILSSVVEPLVYTLKDWVGANLVRPSYSANNLLQLLPFKRRIKFFGG